VTVLSRLNVLSGIIHNESMKYKEDYVCQLFSMALLSVDIKATPFSGTE
jgi:hypothetical protein